METFIYVYYIKSVMLTIFFFFFEVLIYYIINKNIPLYIFYAKIMADKWGHVFGICFQ